MRKQTLLGALFSTSILALTACGGGGVGTSTLPPTATQATTQTMAVSFTINIPTVASNSSTRSAKFVSPNTQWAAVAINSSGSLVNSNTFNAALPGIVFLSCTSTACSGTVQAPLGSDTFQVALGNGTPSNFGPVLSWGTTTTTIAEGQPNVVNIAFGGVPAEFSISPATPNPAFTIGTPGSVIINFTIKDASGATIVGPAWAAGTTVTLAHQFTFEGNITPTPFGLDSFLGGNVVNPGDSSRELDYGGGTQAQGGGGGRPINVAFSPDRVQLIVNPAPLGSGAAGSIPGSVASTFVDFVSAPLNPMTGPANVQVLGAGTANAQTATISEANYGTSNFAVTTSNSAVATATVGATSGGTATVTVTGIAAGTCNLIVTDTHGQTLTIPVSVTVTTISGS